MLYYIHFQGKEYKVRVESRPDGWHLKFGDEEEAKVDFQYRGNFCSFIENKKVFSGTVHGNQGEYTLWRPAGNLSFTVESEYRRIVGLLRGQELEQENGVYAKMPGKIVKLLVKEGQEVQANDPILIMEAMKMENEIRAKANGKIGTLHVKEGQAVETGALLVSLN